MKSRISVALLAGVVLVLALALSACGGSSDSPSSETAPASTEESSSGSTTAEAGDGELTPPGTELSVGETATVAWNPTSELEPNKANPGTKLEATVESIEEAPASDFSKEELEEDGKSTPYYVNFKFKAIDAVKKGTLDNPAADFVGITTEGSSLSAINFASAFEPCEEVQLPQPFESGDEFETCFAYFVLGGGKIKGMQWGDGPQDANGTSEYFVEPVIWNAAG
jgi:hypothetical protein